MAKNKDGFEIGQSVSFCELQKTLAKKRCGNHVVDAPKPKAKPKAKPKKTESDDATESEQ